MVSYFISRPKVVIDAHKIDGAVVKEKCLSGEDESQKSRPGDEYSTQVEVFWMQSAWVRM